MSEPCRGCDGRGYRLVTDKLNVLRDPARVPCSRCSASGAEPGPPKGGGRRFFGSRVKQSADELTLEQQADAFLAARGYRKGGGR